MSAKKRLWHRLDGSANIEYIMTWDASDPNWFWKSMYLLYCLGLADFKDERPDRDDPRPPEPTLPVTAPAPSIFMTSAEAAAAAAPPVHRTARIEPGTSPQPKPAPPPGDAAGDIGEILDEAVILRKRMGNLNHYELFGLRERPTKAKSRRLTSSWPGNSIPIVSAAISTRI